MLLRKCLSPATEPLPQTSHTPDLVHFITMAASLCGGVVSSRRGLLASLWSLVTALTAVAFLLALIFTLSANSGSDNDDAYNYNDDKEENKDQELDAVMAVTSRAMAFAALWTAVLATLMGIFGTVILGWQSPTGQYYTCCSTAVHRTTPLALGSFIGALLMFANLTLVCSVLFGEFEVSFVFVGLIKLNCVDALGGGILCGIIK